MDSMLVSDRFCRYLGLNAKTRFMKAHLVDRFDSEGAISGKDIIQITPMGNLEETVQYLVPE